VVIASDGSGKSTLVDEIAHRFTNVSICGVRKFHHPPRLIVRPTLMTQLADLKAKGFIPVPAYAAIPERARRASDAVRGTPINEDLVRR
jgi:hypothetical protein